MLRRSRLSRGQHVSNATDGGPEQDEATIRPHAISRARRARDGRAACVRQGLERGHRPGWPNPRGAALVGVCPGHQRSYLATRPRPETSVRVIGVFISAQAVEGYLLHSHRQPDPDGEDQTGDSASAGPSLTPNRRYVTAATPMRSSRRVLISVVLASSRPGSWFQVLRQGLVTVTAAPRLLLPAKVLFFRARR